MLEELAGELGRWTGDIARDLLGFCTKLFVYTLVVFCVWAVPWDRILSKAGYVGKTYWTLLTLIVFPVWFIPGFFSWIGTNTPVMQTISELSGFAVYGAFVFIAVAPWPVRRKAKSQVAKPGQLPRGEAS